jgi:hypothetical protein
MSDETIIARIGEARMARGASIEIYRAGSGYGVEYDFGVANRFNFSTHADAVAKAAKIFARGHVASIRDHVEEEAAQREAERSALEMRLSWLLDEASVPVVGDVTEVVLRSA